MRVGHAAAAFEVPDGTPLGGYAADGRRADGTADALEVHAVSLATDARRLVLVVADVVCVNADLAGAVRTAVARGLDGDERATEVWVAATHTHSGPDVGSRPGGGPTPPAWLARLTDVASRAALRAVAAERDCTLAHGAGPLDDVGSVRAAATPATVPIGVLAFRSGPGALAGVLAVLPVHPTVLPATSHVVSGDLASATRRALGRRLARAAGSDAPWVVVATGAAGDISTRRTRRASTPAECERLGGLAARRLAALVSEASAPLRPPGPPLQTERATLRVAATTDDRAALAALRSRLRARLADADAAGDVAAARTAATALQGVEIALRRRPTEAGFGVEVATARIGELTLHAIGGEPFLRTACELAEHAPGPCLVLGYANGYVGYLPPHDPGAEPTYEVLASPLSTSAAADVTAELVQQALTHHEEFRP